MVSEEGGDDSIGIQPTYDSNVSATNESNIEKQFSSHSTAVHQNY
jgi:citrate lyase gamma subunit